MNIKHFWLAVILSWISPFYAQQILIEGQITDSFTEVPLPQVKVSLEGFTNEVFSDENGKFLLEQEAVSGDYILKIERSGYVTKRIPVRSSIDKRYLGIILLEPDLAFEQSQVSTIFLSEAELNSEENNSDNISGILQSSRDVFQNAAAFDFGQTFFRPRGLGSEYGKVLINGLEMNQEYDGRPVWSSWGGLNDVQRNQVFSPSITANDFGFGGLGGMTNIIMRASKYPSGGRITASASNRSYSGRLMATYASGQRKNDWYYAVSASRRIAGEGLIDGTVYEGNSVFLSVEKRITEQHALNFSAIYTPLIRGKSAPLTTEVFNLKGRYYNPYWGMQNGEIRNSRMKEIDQPIFQLNHFWQIGSKAELNTNLMFETGTTANSRIDYSGSNFSEINGQFTYFGSGQNPDPAYYQKLPSYFLRFNDNQNFEAAWRAEKQFLVNGQLDWDRLYQANLQAADTGQNTVYALVNDVNTQRRFTANTILNFTISDHLKLTSNLTYKKFRSENYAKIDDLLGGNQFLDIDVYAEDVPGNGFGKQGDLQNFNRLVSKNDHYKYDYDIIGSSSEAFSQLQFRQPKYEAYMAATVSADFYQRIGHYQNGLYPASSLGKSERLEFLDYGLKTGGLYKFSGKQNLELNLAYFRKSPGFRNTFINPRQNNLVVPGITSERISNFDLTYRYRISNFNLRLTGYFSEIRNATEVSYYFAEGLSGIERETTAAFIQEVLTGLGKRHYGLEFGIEYQVTPTIKLKSAVGLGENLYSENPDLLVSSATFSNMLDYGKSYLTNYHLPGGPQTAAQIGFEYRDTQYWWFGTSLNYFDRAYIDVNPLSRTANFQTDCDGLPLLDYEQEIAKKLLKQEELDNYFLWNATGGKSWRLKDKYLGLFASLNNILNTLYKTGGFEQARNSNYRELKEDFDREYPLFGPKYWFGAGTTFFVNLNLRF